MAKILKISGCEISSESIAQLLMVQEETMREGATKRKYTQITWQVHGHVGVLRSSCA